MAEISKQALLVANNTDFPNNNAGAITPAILRSFNTDMIDSTVNQTQYNTNSGSWNVSIGALNTFTSSQQPQFTNLNAFTASQLTINSGYNAATQSLSASIAPLQPQITSLQNFTASINQIADDGIVQGTSTRLYFYGLVSASIVQNVGGPIASINILQDSTKAGTGSVNDFSSSLNQLNSFSASALNSISSLSSQTASYNQVTSSLNAYTASNNTTINAYSASFYNLNTFTASAAISLNNLNLATASLANSIATKLNTSSFNAYTQSINGIINGIDTGSYATTGSNSFKGNQIISGSLTITGSIYNNVISASIASSTASLDFSKANFFTVTLPANDNTFINVQNMQLGQTGLVKILNAGTKATASFSTNVYQPDTSYYIPTSVSGSKDILTLTSFTSNEIFLVSVKNMTNNY
jgi:hypothetical protein